jgi:hypothetical protein
MQARLQEQLNHNDQTKQSFSPTHAHFIEHLLCTRSSKSEKVRVHTVKKILEQELVTGVKDEHGQCIGHHLLSLHKWIGPDQTGPDRGRREDASRATATSFSHEEHRKMNQQWSTSYRIHRGMKARCGKSVRDKIGTRRTQAGRLHRGSEETKRGNEKFSA